MNSERKAFEEYYIANHHDGDIHPNQQLLEWSEKGEFYFATSVNDLWDMWYASVNRQGYKLVPVEPTKQMISAGMGIFSFPLDNGRFSDCELIFSYREMIGAVNE